MTQVIGLLGRILWMSGRAGSVRRARDLFCSNDTCTRRRAGGSTFLSFFVASRCGLDRPIKAYRIAPSAAVEVILSDRLCLLEPLFLHRD
jgi:hypothetical protein